MLKKVFRYLLLVSLLFLSVNIYAERKISKEKTIVKVDSTKLTAAKFERDAIREYAAQKEFQYDKDIQPQLSWWDKFWMWFWNSLGKLVGGASSNPISKYFFIVLGIAILAFVVIKIIGAESIFSKKAKETILPYDIMDENIHEIDYEGEFQRLLSEGKYRLAVRLLYLKTLKKLSDAEIIEWQPDKTNYTYFMEINKPN